MLGEYQLRERERAQLGLPPLPLTPDQADSLCDLLITPPNGQEILLLSLLLERVSPGVDPAAAVKAAFLKDIVSGEKNSPLITHVEAVRILGGMLGGYNVAPLVAALRNPLLADEAAKALAHIILVYDAFNDVASMCREGSETASRLMLSWAEAEWFTSRGSVPENIKLKVYKVDGEINTDDFSPAAAAWSRPDIPLHALEMGKTRFPDGIKTIAAFREEGCHVAFVGDVIGTGSSRKSACNSLLWAIGDDIPGVPNKRSGGLIIGGAIAPIFFNTARDSGALPLEADVTGLKTGDVILVDTLRGCITDESGGKVFSDFSLNPVTLADEYRAGGRVRLIIGRVLTGKARAFLGLPEAEFFARPDNPSPKPGQGYTLAQKIVGFACGTKGALSGTSCEPVMTTVGSQDTDRKSVV